MSVSTAELSVSLKIVEKGVGGLGSKTVKVTPLYTQQWSAATIRTHYASSTLNGSEDYDLAGVLADVDGNTLTFTIIYAIMIVHKGASGIINYGGDGSAAFSDMFANANDEGVIQPGGMALLVAPGGEFTPTATSADLFEITTSASLTYEIYIVGAIAS